MSSRRVLLTGGAGYVGSHCAVHLLEAGHQVVVIDNLVNATVDSSGNTNKPESLLRVEKLTKKNVEFFNCDLLNITDLNNVFQNFTSQEKSIDCVIHCAALKAVGQSFVRVLDYYHNNITGACHLLQTMDKFKVHRLVFSSSATVYGVPDYLPLDEHHKTGNCTNPYGTTKYAVEKLMIDLAASDPKWKFSLLRYFNPAGAHESGDIGDDPLGIPNNLLPYIAQVAVGRREKVLVYGNDYETRDGTGCRDYVHVMDLAAGHVKAVDKILEDSAPGVEVINLGTGEGATVLEVIKAFEEASGKKIPYEVVGRRKGDVDSLFASCQKAEEVLNWKAKLSLKRMCEDMWNWQRKNPKGFAG